MQIEIYINGQHLHSYASDIFRLPDLSSSIEFSTFRQRCEYREQLASHFIGIVEAQLLVNSISEGVLMYLLFRSNFEKPKTITKATRP